MAKRQRRAGATETFSVSVDRETKAALRALAKSEFEGNMSALVTDLATEARQRLAAARYLKRHGIPKLTKREAEELHVVIDSEVLAASQKAKRKAG